MGETDATADASLKPWMCVQEFYVKVQEKKFGILSVNSQQPYSLADRLCTMDGLGGSTEWFVQRRSDGEYGCWRPFDNNKFFIF